MATLLIAGLAVLVNVVSSLVRKRFTDIEQTKRIQKEVRDFNTELRQAILSKNKEKEAKLKKRQSKMNEMQMKMMSQNMKTSMIFMLPFFGVWWLIVAFFGYETIVAFAPVTLPLLSSGGSLVFSNGLNFFWWYFLSSIAFSGIIMKILGTSLSD
ncbi:MAG: DUF106 domain-containing protein [Thaumarchaeota archaeon]|nr:DUF106 domain-containing protein [Nitrososphaerota archaeon]